MYFLNYITRMNILVLEDSSKVGMGGGQQIILNVISTFDLKEPKLT